uniref:Uncharacterized protein n=1 Tax=Lepeophtheirus salmonis TaxID=72036 RepID=A0A0K2U8S3_LEPSM
MNGVAVAFLKNGFSRQVLKSLYCWTSRI